MPMEIGEKQLRTLVSRPVSRHDVGSCIDGTRNPTMSALGVGPWFYTVKLFRAPERAAASRRNAKL